MGSADKSSLWMWWRCYLFHFWQAMEDVSSW